MPRRKRTPKTRTTAQLRAMWAKLKGKRFKGKGKTETDSLGYEIKVYPRKRQIGKSNRRVDKRIRALEPGKRISSAGNTYYEYRKNRSDINRKEKL